MITDNNKEALKEYFKTRKDVAFAFLFGSQARGTATKLSDIDIAVYFYPEKKHPIEYEEEVFYVGEDDIWADLERILKERGGITCPKQSFCNCVCKCYKGHAPDHK